MVWNGLITFLNLIPRTTIDFIGLLYVSKAQVILSSYIQIIILAVRTSSNRQLRMAIILCRIYISSLLLCDLMFVIFPCWVSTASPREGGYGRHQFLVKIYWFYLSLICPLFCWAGEFFFSCEPSPPPFSVPIEQVCLLFWDWAHASAFVCFLLLW